MCGFIGQRSGQRVQTVFVQKRCIGIAVQERWMAQHVDQQVAVGGQPVYARAFQCRRQ